MPIIITIPDDWESQLSRYVDSDNSPELMAYADFDSIIDEIRSWIGTTKRIESVQELAAPDLMSNEEWHAFNRALMSLRNPDRHVHVSLPHLTEVVRYDRAGKWFMEWPDGRREPLTVAQAAQAAMLPHAEWHEREPGGSRFDALVRRYLAEAQEHGLLR